MKHLFFLTMLIAFVLQGCNVGTTKYCMDESIKQRLRNEIQALDKKVLEAVTTNNPHLIRTILSDKLLEKDGNNIDLLIKQAGSVIPNADYRILNQFYVKNSTTGIGNTIMSGKKGLNDYMIHYQSINKEIFISVLIPKGGLDEFIITNIYGKYPDGWRLNIIQFGQYKVNGQTAPELYSKAKEKYEKGYLIDAAMNIFLCLQVANPANKFWKYQKGEEMKRMHEKIMTSVKSRYSFPLTLEEIDSKPQIFTINPQGMNEGYFPIIAYLTNIDLEDTIGTKEENEKIHKIIGKTFSGIDKDKKYIFYKAFSQVPDGKTPVPTYGFVKELK